MLLSMLAPRPLVAALAVALAAGCADDAAPDVLDPDLAPVLAVDRFSDAAGTILRRSLDPTLPGPDQPIDLDQPPFLIRGLGPGGEPLTFYNLDAKARAPVPVYRLHRAGETAGVPGQLNLFDYVPGQHGYNDLWRVIDVEVPADYVANSVTSTRELNRRGYPFTPTQQLVNCPMVPAGSVARLRQGIAGPELRRGWYEDHVVYYVTFEEAPVVAGEGGIPTSPIHVAYRIDPGQPGGGPLSGFRTEPATGRTHNVAATLPADDGYSPLREVLVYGGAAFDGVHDLASAVAAPHLDGEGLLLNLPVVAAP